MFHLESLWVFLNGADLCVNCHKVILCDSSGEWLNSDISRLLLSGYRLYFQFQIKEIIITNDSII